MIDYIETHIVDHCNLKCRGCSHFSCISDEYFKDLNEFKEELRDLAEKEEVRTIRIMGGEPLLHPEWFYFLETAKEIFPSANVTLVTNGLLFNKIEPYIDRINELGLGVCLSDYQLDLKGRYILDRIHNKVIHGKGSLYNISLDLNGNQDVMTSFYNCDLSQNKWYFFKNGRLFTCCIFANIDIFKRHFGIDIDYDIDDVSIEVKSHTAEEIERFLTTPHKACKYCNTIKRKQTYRKFETSKKEVSEWI